MSESNVPAGLAPDSVSEYLKQVRVVHRQLGISPSCCHGRIYLQNEAVVYCGPDLYGRHLYLDKEAADAWLGLQARARMNRVTIVAVSGFRTLHYQYEIIKKKLQRGESLSQILKVNAAPGFSQHHTGLALDVADENNRSHPLTEEFERSRAFRWLTDHASHFGFSLQYPRNNPDGYVYEPWHWALSKVSSFAMYPGAIAVEMET